MCKKDIRDQRCRRFWGMSTFWHRRVHANGSRTQRMRDNKGTTSVLLWLYILNICWSNSSCPATCCQWPTASGRSIKRSSGPKYNSNVACLPSLPVRCVYNSVYKSLYSMSPTWIIGVLIELLGQLHLYLVQDMKIPTHCKSEDWAWCVFLLNCHFSGEVSLLWTKSKKWKWVIVAVGWKQRGCDKD